LLQIDGHSALASSRIQHASIGDSAINRAPPRWSSISIALRSSIEKAKTCLLDLSPIRGRGDLKQKSEIRSTKSERWNQILGCDARYGGRRSEIQDIPYPASRI